MTTWTNDTFTNTNGVKLDAHVGESGATWTPVSTFGGTNKPVIINNRIRGNDTGDKFWLSSGVADADGEWVDLKIHKLDSLGVAVGCMLRGTAGGSYYFALWHSTASGGLLALYRCINAANNGVGTQVASVTNISMPLGATSLRFKATGTGDNVLLEAFAKGSSTPTLSYTDTAANRIVTPGRAGLYFGSASTDTTGVHIDSIEMTNTVAAAAPTFTFTAPVAGRIHQRSGTTGTIKVAGTYTESPVSIEARLIRDSDNTAVAGFDWSTKVASPTGGAFAFNFDGAPMDAWLKVQMRDSANPGTVSTSPIVGVGRLYAAIGQSNARDFMYFGSNTLTPDPRVRAHGYMTRTPQSPPFNTWLAPDPLTCDGAIAFGNALATAHNGLIGFLDLAVSGTSMQGGWIPTSSEPYARFRDAVLALDGKIEGAFWIQGENESASGVAENTYYDNLTTLFANIRTDLGQPTLPIALVTLASIPLSGYTTDTKIEAIRRAQVRKCADANVYRVDRIDLPLEDQIHHTAAGFATLGARVANVFKYIAGLSSYYRGPRISAAVKVNATTFDLNVAHSGGSDFTPTSGITGLRALDGATPITISSAVRQSASVVRVVLASAPAALPTFQNLYGATPDHSGVVKDNSALALPLEWNSGVVATEVANITRTVSITLGDANGAAANLSGLMVSLRLGSGPHNSGAVLYQSASETTDASGVLAFTFESVDIDAGGVAVLDVLASDGRNLCRAVTVA